MTIFHYWWRIGRITSRRGEQCDQKDGVRVQQECDALRVVARNMRKEKSESGCVRDG